MSWICFSESILRYNMRTNGGQNEAKLGGVCRDRKLASIYYERHRRVCRLKSIYDNHTSFLIMLRRTVLSNIILSFHHTVVFSPNIHGSNLLFLSRSDIT